MNEERTLCRECSHEECQMCKSCHNKECAFFEKSLFKCYDFLLNKPYTPIKQNKEVVKEIIYKHAKKGGMSEAIEDGQIIGLKTGTGLELDAVADEISTLITQARKETAEEIFNMINDRESLEAYALVRGIDLKDK